MEASDLDTSTEKQFQWRIRLGTVLGFPFFVHLSFFLWFIGLFWVEGNRLILFISLLLFSISVHEFAHAIVCRWLGLGGGTLTIWFLGGYFLPFSQVSLFEMNRNQRFRYILMIFAGPLSNVILSGLFIFLAYITSMETLYVAARYNLTLAIINLLPVGMLDGGRILAYLASTIVNWRKALFFTGLLSLVLAVSVFVAVFSDHWIGRYSNWTGFLISMGIVTIKESRKSEGEIRVEAQDQVSKEIAFVEETNRTNAWLLSLVIAITIVGMLIFSISYLSYYYMLYRDLPGRIAYTTIDNKRSIKLQLIRGMGFPVLTTSGDPAHYPLYLSASKDSKLIAFICNSTYAQGLTSVCIVDQIGRLVTEIPVDEKFRYAEPLLSPDGKQIVLSVHKSEVWVVDVQSGQMQEIFLGGTVGAWSPDGNSILLVAQTDEMEEIWSVNLKTNEFKNLSNNPNNDYAPVYTQDGKALYFVSDRSGEDVLFRMNANDSNIIKITDSIYAKESTVQISPKNSQLAFECGGVGGLICIANADGSDEKQITRGRMPLWSPDGRYIIYQSTQRQGIFVVLPNGKSPFYLTSLDSWKNYYVWLSQ